MYTDEKIDALNELVSTIGSAEQLYKEIGDDFMASYMRELRKDTEREVEELERELDKITKAKEEREYAGRVYCEI